MTDSNDRARGGGHFSKTSVPLRLFFGYAGKKKFDKWQFRESPWKYNGNFGFSSVPLRFFFGYAGKS